MDKRVMLGGLPDDDITTLLQSHLIHGMKRIAGYIAPVMSESDVTSVTSPYALCKPLVLIRNKPVFSMNSGHMDFAVDYLREIGMPCQVLYVEKKRKQNDGTWIAVQVRTNSIAEHVEMLRKYVKILDYKYHQNQP